VSCVLHDGFPVYSVRVFPAKTTFYNFAPTHMHACETLKMNMSCKMLVCEFVICRGKVFCLSWFCVYWENATCQVLVAAWSLLQVLMGSSETQSRENCYCWCHGNHW
jgi:predicted permease